MPPKYTITHFFLTKTRRNLFDKKKFNKKVNRLCRFHSLQIILYVTSLTDTCYYNDNSFIKLQSFQSGDIVNRFSTYHYLGTNLSNCSADCRGLVFFVFSKLIYSTHLHLLKLQFTQKRFNGTELIL